MLPMLDFKTLLLVFALMRILQSVGLLYVWHVHRSYKPAQNWVIGSVLISLGTLAVGHRAETSPGWEIVGGNLPIFAGILIFDAGIIQCCASRVPWRTGLAVMAGAIAVLAWFTFDVTSTAARVALFGIYVAICDGAAMAAALRAPAGPLRPTQWLIAALLGFEGVAALARGLVAVETDLPFVLQSTPTQNGFLLMATIASFLIAVALTILTSQRSEMGSADAARQDSLTGLLNRRAFSESAERDWSRATRRGSALSAIMLDLDHFKEINDQYGHAAGDSVLVAVSRLIQASLRLEDALCRYGGEEFAILLADTDAVGGALLARRLCDAVRGLRLPEIDGKPISISGGVAQRLATDATWEELLSAADRALYDAKRSGRDCVKVSNAFQRPEHDRDMFTLRLKGSLPKHTAKIAPRRPSRPRST